jgi:small subunit ribosomal protein YMR-31
VQSWPSTRISPDYHSQDEGLHTTAGCSPADTIDKVSWKAHTSWYGILPDGRCRADLLAESVDHTPRIHPAAPSASLPDSFVNYRSNVQQHGPLGGQVTTSFSASPSVHQSASSTGAYGAIGGHSGHGLGSIEAKKGEFFDRSELPARFQRTPWTEEEIEAITSGGASMH